MTTWVYDTAGRVTAERRAGGPAGTSFIATHAYDPAGNRTTLTLDGQVTTFSYSPANRLELATSAGGVTTFSHDAAGNRTEEATAPGSTVYAWDAAGRMASAEDSAASGPVTFTYNADGQRVAKEAADGGATGFLYDQARLLHETDEVGGEVDRTCASGTDDEFGDLIGEEGQYAHAYDARANTDALLDDAGSVEARYKYDAYGRVTAAAIGGDTWATLTVNQWSALSTGDWSALGLRRTSSGRWRESKCRPSHRRRWGGWRRSGAA